MEFDKTFEGSILWRKRLYVSYDKNTLIDYKEEYTQIAELCYKDYLQLKKNDGDINRAAYLLSYDRKRLHNCISDNTIILTNGESQSLQTTDDDFYLAKKKLDFIEVQDNFVAFGIVNGRASFIYSLNDDKPNFVNTANENYQRIYVEKITDHWYFSCVRKQ